MLKEATTEYAQLETVIEEMNNRVDEIYQTLDEKVYLVFIKYLIFKLYTCI